VDTGNILVKPCLLVSEQDDPSGNESFKVSSQFSGAKKFNFSEKVEPPGPPRFIEKTRFKDLKVSSQ